MTIATANGALHTAVTDFGKEIVWARLAEKIKTLFPKKTAENLAACTGLQVRSCEFFLSRKSMLNTEAFVSLLHTEHAGEVLKTVMGERQFALMWERERLKSELEKLEREMAGK